MNNGLIDYCKIIEDKWLMNEFIKLEDHNSSNQDDLVFWINTYNLIVIKSVIYELERNNNWNGNTKLYSKFFFFVLRKHKIGSKKYSLFYIENKILRKKFNDPRIHFAINCASYSCPLLPNKLFTRDNLEEYLEYLTYDFINNQSGVIIAEDKMLLNKIFKWYKKDFEIYGGVISFIQKYWKGKEFSPKIKIEYISYNWKLNSM